MSDTTIIEDKKEAVEQTLLELESASEEKQKDAVPKRRRAFVILTYIFFPMTLLTYFVQKITRKIKIPITVKLLFIYSFVFALIIGFYSFFYLSSVHGRLQADEASQAYYKNLVTSTIVLDITFLIVFMALVAVVSTLMLEPIRKISDKIDDITSENLSERLESIDTQDELMELTARINDMLDNLQSSFERQKNFVSDASHELKTPIAVIQGYSNLLKRWGKEKPDILQEGIDAIARESDNMKRIVEQLLLLARLGKMNMNKTVFNLCEVLDDMVEGYRVVNTSHKIAFWGEDEIVVETDKNLLLESVRTLVDNAIKYTPSGGNVNVYCKLNEGSAVISVKDSGLGISEEDLPKIFDRFYRCDKVRGREQGSTGLGLTIAKSIIDMMGGDIIVTSELGKGSNFEIVLY